MNEDHDVEWYFAFDERHGYKMTITRVAHYRAIAKWLRAGAAIDGQPVTSAGAVYDAVADEMERRIKARRAA